MSSSSATSDTEKEAGRGFEPDDSGSCGSGWEWDEGVKSKGVKEIQTKPGVSPKGRLRPKSSHLDLTNDSLINQSLTFCSAW